MPERNVDELSLDELEGEMWGPPPEDATTLMERVHALRPKPIGELTTDNIRLLIGQRIGLPVLLPRALGLLKDEPLLEATYYPGDLLAVVLRVPADYWRANLDALTEVEAILAQVPELPDELQEPAAQFRGATSGTTSEGQA